MSLADGYIDLPPGKIANVVTCLEMRSKPERRDEPQAVCSVRRVESPDPQWYRTLFRGVGEPYLWTSRLVMSDEELLGVIRDPRVEIYAVEVDRTDAGLLELDFRTPGECELTFFGVMPDVVGRGIGRRLMNHAIDFAWSHPIERFWVHTCTLDHPSAIPFYIRSGFVPYKRQIEISDDPRVLGVLPKSAAPQVPVL
ncbi:MAG TPA: GNAT family N-acetyltransferase [Candidatus Baltobacteraceae bacterium]|jgi:GNAT superfamily N-acetyltransferase|nr:GNAT family N-acetyltransferase [Candidatus Baltobacteraceae bacterium]